MTKLANLKVTEKLFWEIKEKAVKEKLKINKFTEKVFREYLDKNVKK